MRKDGDYQQRAEQDAAHTPGPWTYSPYVQDAEEIENLKRVGLRPTRMLNNEGQAIVMAGETRVALVDCQATIRRGKGHTADCAERDANAHLIAAAPEMLEALKEVEWIFDGQEDLTENSGPNDAMKTLAVVRAAIRKATGAA